MEALLREEDIPRWRRAKTAADQRVWQEVQRLDPEAAREAAMVDEVNPRDSGGASGSGGTGGAVAPDAEVVMADERKRERAGEARGQE